MCTDSSLHLPMYAVQVTCSVLSWCSVCTISLYLYKVRTGGRESDSLVVKHHVRQPDVFGGQPDLQHSIKLLRDPSQTIVLPLLKANKNTTLSHSSANHTAGNDILREAERRRCVCLSFCVRHSVTGQHDMLQ